MKWAALTVGIIALGVLAVLGAPGAWKSWYHREAREVRRLAEAIDGVVVIEVDGNHDVTLEDIWLDMEYRGERLYFSSVTADSFSGTDHLRVSQVGGSSFDVRGYVGDSAPSEGTCRLWGSDLDFGPDGDVGRALGRPIRSIPEFLRRLPEVRRIVEALPRSAPGVEVGTHEYGTVVTATGEKKQRLLRLFAHQEPSDW